MKELRPYGVWLREQRTARGLSQKRLGDLVSVDRAHIAQIEGGRIDVPRDELRQRIHEVFGTSDKELWEAAVVLPVSARAEEARTIFAPEGHLRVTVTPSVPPPLPDATTAQAMRAEAHALIEHLPDGALGYLLRTLEIMAGSDWPSSDAAPS